jgi:HlyD family secretion protein
MPQPSTSVRRVGIKTGKVNNALVIPVGAVHSRDGKSTVKVQKGSDWVSVVVETGLSDGNLIEVKSGLSEGAVVQVPTAS